MRVCVCWWGRECDVIFNITEGGLRTNFFSLGGGFLLDNSGFSGSPPPPPLLIIIAQSLTTRILNFMVIEKL